MASPLAKLRRSWSRACEATTDTPGHSPLLLALKVSPGLWCVRPRTSLAPAVACPHLVCRLSSVLRPLSILGWRQPSPAFGLARRVRACATRDEVGGLQAQGGMLGTPAGVGGGAGEQGRGARPGQARGGQLATDAAAEWPPHPIRPLSGSRGAVEQQTDGQVEHKCLLARAQHASTEDLSHGSSIQQ